jgi:choline dehydrogenase-like flavoprotein
MYHRRRDGYGRVKSHYDVIIIGSGAGGGTVARVLAGKNADVLLLERGSAIPREDANRDPAVVWGELRYRAKERWLDAEGKEFLPYTHYCVGGNTKFWGSALFRLRREDFGAIEHVDGTSPAWPITYDTLAPYYDRAERLYHVHGRVGDDPTEPPRAPYPYAPVPHAPLMASIVEGMRAQGLHPSHLPIGVINPGEEGGCILCNTCNSFPCQFHAKSDAEVCAVLPALEHDNVTLWPESYAERLITDPSGTRVEAVEIRRDGQPMRLTASRFVVSCGAVNSAALLLRSATDKHPNGLANSSGLVGRRYMAHLATMMEAFHPRINDTVFQKTVAVNDFYFAGPRSKYPLGQIQSQGRAYAVQAKTVVPWIPMWMYDAWMARGVDFLAMTEDLPKYENRVTVERDGRIRLTYTPNNVTAHKQLVAETKRILRDLGYWLVVGYSHNKSNTTHQCGTLCFGTDPAQSVLDTFCRTHDVENLFVIDASFFPSSAAVNPALTIVAQALRAADHLVETL